MPASGFPEVFESCLAFPELVIAEREIVGERSLECLQLHALFKPGGSLFELASFVQLARFVHRVFHALANFFVQMLDGVGYIFHFDQRLGLGVHGARLDQLSGFLQAPGLRGHGLDLGFHVLFLGLFQIVRRQRGAYENENEDENRCDSHSAFRELEWAISGIRLMALRATGQRQSMLRTGDSAGRTIPIAHCLKLFGKENL